MDKRELEKGDVVQISPEYGAPFGGCFMTITEPKSWGAQGYILVPGAEGVAYFRCGFSGMEYIGKAEWGRDNSGKKTERRALNDPEEADEKMERKEGKRESKEKAQQYGS